MQVKILGSGCKKCKTLESNTNAAAQAAGIDIDIEKITDIAAIAGFGVMSTPSMVINDKVVCSGRVLPEAEIAKLLRKATDH